MSFAEKLRGDESVFGKSMVENCILNSWKKRLWGAWKVLCGDAGIILVRLKHEDCYEQKH